MSKQNPEKNYSNENSYCGLYLFEPKTNYSLPVKTDIEPKYDDFYTLVQTIKGNGWFWTKETDKISFSAANCIIMVPGLNYDIAAEKEDTIIDQISFSGPLCNILIKEGVLKEGVYSFDSTRNLISISEQIKNKSKQQQYSASLSFQNLLLKIYHQTLIEYENDPRSRLNDLVAEIKRVPEKWWNCTEMAAFCRLGEVQMRRLFNTEMGCSPKLFIDKVKLDKATKLLKQNFSVSTVADLLGYSDQFHFSRRFKAIKGMSPREYIQKNCR